MSVRNTKVGSMDKVCLAIPNGSMEKQIISMLLLVGLCITRAARQFRVKVNHPLIDEVVFMRPQHMTELVGRGNYDLAICGQDFYQEYAKGWNKSNQRVEARRLLGSKADIRPTKIVLFCDKDDLATSATDVSVEEPVISEYPALTESWFLQYRPIPDEVLNGPSEYFVAHYGLARGKIVPSCGSTEAHVPRDYRFGVCLTETGASLAANGLKVIEVLMETCPVLLFPSQEFHEIPASKKKAIKEVVALFEQAGLL